MNSRQLRAKMWLASKMSSQHERDLESFKAFVAKISFNKDAAQVTAVDVEKALLKRLSEANLKPLSVEQNGINHWKLSYQGADVEKLKAALDQVRGVHREKDYPGVQDVYIIEVAFPS